MTGAAQARSTRLTALNRGLAELSERVRLTLVRVLDGRRGSGAGVIVHEKGLVVTSAHVIGAGRMAVEVAGAGRNSATVVAVDPRRDLAALALKAGHYRALALGDADRLEAGAWVLAFGHPLGVTGGATAGAVIGVGPDLPEIPDSGVNWLALALHLRPGHSGGPVVDSRGRLVGVNARMAGPHVGLAVAVNEVKTFLKEAMGAESAGPGSGKQDRRVVV